MYNVNSELVFALKATDVRTVVIAGRVIMDERKALTLNEDEILQKAREYQKQIVASLAQK
jgi:5-methylthioadenosine/S-adenosylhomocysteine deaminase